MSNLQATQENEREVATSKSEEETPKTKIKPLLMYNGLLVSGLVVYAFIGALAFYVIEGRNELREIAKLNDNSPDKQHLIRNLWNERDLTYDDWSKLADEAIAGYKAKEESPTRQWGLANSWLFAWTIFTTVGYGNICPVTCTARFFCMLYAIVGIPLFSVVASSLGSLIIRLIQEGHKIYQKKKRQREAAKQKKTDDVSINDETIPEMEIKLKHVAGGTMGYLLFGSLLFAVGEGWGLCESFYYCFITFTTIGLGDYVPQHIHHTTLFTLYLLVGLIVFNCLLFSALEDKIQQKLQKIKDKLKIKDE